MDTTPTMISDETSKREKAGRMRDRALCELVETEKTYVNGLGKLIIIYMNPLKHNNCKLSISDHQTIFPSVISTIYNLHNQLLAELDYNYNNEKDSKVGQILIKYAELFKMYQIYMNSYDRAIKSLSLIKKKNKKLNKWLSSQSVKTSNQMLESLLILPIQRIPRYQLLLKEIIKNTQRYDCMHCDLYDLKNGYDQICEITALIELKMAEFDNKKLVKQIEKRFHNINQNGVYLVTPSRSYISESKHGDQVRIHNQDASYNDITMFVFNDCLVYGHHRKCNDAGTNIVKNISLIANDNKLYFDHLLPFDNVFRVEREDYYKDLHCLKIYSRKHSIWLSFASIEIREKWFDIIEKSNEEMNNKFINKFAFYSLSSTSSAQNNNCNTIGGGVSDAFNDKEMAQALLMPDDYCMNCMECQIKFTFIVRKHHCHSNCGRLLCKQCSNYRINAFDPKSSKNQIVRVCKKCKDYNTFAILRPKASGMQQFGGNKILRMKPSQHNRTLSTPMNNKKKKSSISMAYNNNHNHSQTRTRRVNERRKKMKKLHQKSKSDMNCISYQITVDTHEKTVKNEKSKIIKKDDSDWEQSVCSMNGYIREIEMPDSDDSDEHKGNNAYVSTSMTPMSALHIPMAMSARAGGGNDNSKKNKHKKGRKRGVTHHRRSRSNALGVSDINMNATSMSYAVGCTITDDDRSSGNDSAFVFDIAHTPSKKNHRNNIGSIGSNNQNINQNNQRKKMKKKANQRQYRFRPQTKYVVK